MIVYVSVPSGQVSVSTVVRTVLAVSGRRPSLIKLSNTEAGLYKGRLLVEDRSLDEVDPSGPGGGGECGYSSVCDDCVVVSVDELESLSEVMVVVLLGTAGVVPLYPCCLTCLGTYRRGRSWS